MNWLRKNARWLGLITASIASIPFLPEWARVIASVGSQVLGSGDLSQ